MIDDSKIHGRKSQARLDVERVITMQLTFFSGAFYLYDDHRETGKALMKLLRVFQFFGYLEALVLALDPGCQFL